MVKAKSACMKSQGRDKDFFFHFIPKRDQEGLFPKSCRKWLLISPWSFFQKELFNGSMIIALNYGNDKLDGNYNFMLMKYFYGFSLTCFLFFSKITWCRYFFGLFAFLFLELYSWIRINLILSRDLCIADPPWKMTKITQQLFDYRTEVHVVDEDIIISYNLPWLND